MSEVVYYGSGWIGWMLVEERMEPTPRQASTQARIAKAMAEIGFALPGSLTVGAYKCGKPNCRCKADPPQLHGPYALWTRKIDNKTVTRRLNDEELATYQPLFDNAKRLRALMAELHELTLELLDQRSPSARSPQATNKTVPAQRSTPKRSANRPRKRQAV